MPAGRRRSGSLHIDWAASKFVTRTVQLGVVGYCFQQITDDSGPGAVLGGFRGMTVEIGPQVGFLFPKLFEGYQGYLNLKAYKDLAPRTGRRASAPGDILDRAGGVSAACAPWGLFGGKAAEVGSVTVYPPDSDRVSITKVTQTPVRKGTRVTFLTAGGGGVGDPFERPVRDVACDVEMGYVSVERASQDCGVVVSAQGEVDEHATAERRKARSYFMPSANAVAG